jgi:hypothetical protein
LTHWNCHEEAPRNVAEDPDDSGAPTGAYTVR